MYEVLKQLLDKEPDYENKLNRTREFLQVLMLKIMFDRGAFDNIAFVGGTALRIIYGLRRFSEDMDFSLVRKPGYSFGQLVKELSYELKNYGFRIESNTDKKGVVHSSLVKFPGLPEQMGLSRLPGQKLSIKIEIDTNPPKGWKIALTPVTSSFVFAVKHFDLPSLYATKLHACFFRRYTKGRDFYDLVWYLGKKITPNFVLLNNAIRQTEKKDLGLNAGNLKAFILGKAEGINFVQIKKDVERFLENKSELKLLDKGVIKQMLANPG
ncbi:MAG: nucleotidyl transferase AbiEii/AbiGii toxin family protein [Planctomycetota bacterium]